MTKNVAIVIKVDEDMRDRLDAAAGREMRSRTNLVEKILSDYLAGVPIGTENPIEFEDI